MFNLKSIAVTLALSLTIGAGPATVAVGEESTGHLINFDDVAWATIG